MLRKAKSNKKVLLVTNSFVLDDEVLLHGINLSKRMDASLEVVHFLKLETAVPAEQSFRESTTTLGLAEYIEYTQVFWDRDFTREAIEYAKNRRNLLCVILFQKSGEVKESKAIRQKKFKEVTQLLNCPVVLYSDSPVYL